MHGQTKEFHTALTDVLWLLTIEAPEADTAPERKRLVDLVRRIHTGGAVPGAVLKERLDPTLMAKAGLISLSHFRTRAVRLHTRELYVAASPSRPRLSHRCSDSWLPLPRA